MIQIFLQPTYELMTFMSECVIKTFEEFFLLCYPSLELRFYSNFFRISFNVFEIFLKIQIKFEAQLLENNSRIICLFNKVEILD